MRTILRSRAMHVTFFRSIALHVSACKCLILLLFFFLLSSCGSGHQPEPSERFSLGFTKAAYGIEEVAQEVSCDWTCSFYASACKHACMQAGAQTGWQDRRQTNLLAPSPPPFHTRPMIIAVVNQKGGVAKTTLAVHLAAWQLEQGRRVAFIDADGQSSATRWLTAGGFPITLVTEVRPDPIIELAGTLQTTHDVIIADGPASLAESTRALLLVTDFALVPCGVTVPELESTAETIRMIRSARLVRATGKPDASLVLTRVRDDRFVLTREAHDAARLLGLPVCRSVLRLREAVADAPGQRTVVWKMGARAGPAAKEMRQILEEIDHHAREETNQQGSTDGGTTSIPAQRIARRVAVGA